MCIWNRSGTACNLHPDSSSCSLGQYMPVPPVCAVSVQMCMACPLLNTGMAFMPSGSGFGQDQGCVIGCAPGFYLSGPPTLEKLTRVETEFYFQVEHAASVHQAHTRAQWVTVHNVQPVVMGPIPLLPMQLHVWDALNIQFLVVWVLLVASVFLALQHRLLLASSACLDSLQRLEPQCVANVLLAVYGKVFLDMCIYNQKKTF